MTDPVTARAELEERIVHELMLNGKRLRELGHAHANLDANARHLIANIALDALLANPAALRAATRPTLTPEQIAASRHTPAVSVLHRAQRAEALLNRWVATTADANGALTTHWPITGSGRACDASEAWGCNSCGKGWPCLTAQTSDHLNSKDWSPPAPTGEETPS